MKKSPKILIIIYFILNYFSGFSQSKITGKVIDEEFNETMPFANVLIKGTNTGVTTDFDGNYTINLDSGTYTLIFSFVGRDFHSINSESLISFSSFTSCS